MLRALFLRAAAAALAAAGTVAAQPAAGPRLLVVTGGHEHETSFFTLFDGYQATCAAPNQFAFRADMRKKFDVLVLYDMMQELSDAGRRNLQNFAEAGKGIVVMHHALCSYNDWPWYRDMVGARYLLKPDGAMPASSYKHDQEFAVRPVAKHPVTEGIEPFRITDEAYKGVWHSPEIQVLLTVDHPLNDSAVAWISPYAKSRVAVLQLGHDHMAHQNPSYRRLVKNAVEWAAGRR